MVHRPSEKEESFAERLARADAKLSPNKRSKKAGGAPSSNGNKTLSEFGVAMRLGTELVAGLAVGVAIGYALGCWLGYKVVFIVIFALFGCGAGMINAWRFLNGPALLAGPTNDGRSQRGCRIDD
ncbi:AtpZ/AtpI family protein [Neokomagataea tanensis]|uniref:AtpZ/AtpI family protein n=1 Tax=Neokomagataea tanensis TaxID=661191 RepID=A0A4Y6V6R3_9PROT|nr:MULTISPECIES: AtpZ/AtpI family protein [Neokomagataea]QDH24548.1 AtpZ/AtpI family protein [Neokomagataea tanensis]